MLAFSTEDHTPTKSKTSGKFMVEDTSTLHFYIYAFRCQILSQNYISLTCIPLPIELQSFVLRR